MTLSKDVRRFDLSRYFYQETSADSCRTDIQRNLRAKRTNVALLEYSDDNTVKLERYKEPYDGNCHSAAELKERLQQLGEEPGNGKKARFRLFVVEDLSRDVIETLGYHLKIDPRFFRSHLVDYAWNNIRDPWREPRTSQVNAQQQDWFQIRFIRSRYFTDKDSLEASYHESNEFNVQRRVDPDENESFWDSDENYARERSRAEKKGAEATAAAEKAVEAKVGLIRSRATIWMRHETDGATIGRPWLCHTLSELNSYFILQEYCYSIRLSNMDTLFGGDMITGSRRPCQAQLLANSSARHQCGATTTPPPRSPGSKISSTGPKSPQPSKPLLPTKTPKTHH